MKSGTKLALLLVPVFVVALFLLFQRGPRASEPEALDLVRASDTARVRSAPTVELESPVESNLRESGKAPERLFPFDLRDALRIRLESSKEFTFDRVWVKTATEPRWVARSVLKGMELPYLKSELPLDISAPGHGEYPVNRPIEYALLLVDAYTVLDLSGLGQRLCMSSGFVFDFGDAYTVPPFPERFIHRQVGDQIHLALRRNSGKWNARSRLTSEFGLTTACGWQLRFTWKPMPKSSSTLDVAAKIKVPSPSETSVTVRLSAPFEFDPEDFELFHSSNERQRLSEGQIYGEAEASKFRLLAWGEILVLRDPAPRKLSRSGATWTLNNLTVARQGMIVARNSSGESFGRWLGVITPDLSVELRLERGVFISGRLVEFGTERPVRHGEVALAYNVKQTRSRFDSGGPKPEAWARTIQVPTNADGQFRVSTTSPPSTKYWAPSRPSPEFWATFSAPFCESQRVHRNESGREIDLGEIVLTPSEPDISLPMTDSRRIPLDTFVILKRKGIPDPKLCRVVATRHREGRLDLDVKAHSLNTGTIHQVGPDEPSQPVQSGLILAPNTPIPFTRRSDSQSMQHVGTRELEIELTLPKSLDPKFSADLSYDWNGLLIAAASFKAADTREPIFLRRIVPDEEIELFIQSKEAKLDQQITVPRGQKRVVLGN